MSGPQGIQQMQGIRQNAAQQYAGLNRGAMGSGAMPPRQGPLPTPINLNMMQQPAQSGFTGGMNDIIGSLARSFVDSGPTNVMGPASRLFAGTPELQQHLQQNAYDQIYQNMYRGLLPNYESAGGGNA